MLVVPVVALLMLVAFLGGNARVCHARFVTMSVFYRKQPGQLATIQTIVYALGLQLWMQKGQPKTCYTGSKH